MDQTLKSFIKRANIARYIEQMKTETDPVKQHAARDTFGRRKMRSRSVAMPLSITEHLFGRRGSLIALAG